jgi:hypothetical protein
MNAFQNHRGIAALTNQQKEICLAHTFSCEHRADIQAVAQGNASTFIAPRDEHGQE